MTQDGGSNWDLISASLPNRWVTRVKADPLNSNGVFVTLSGYRYGEDGFATRKKLLSGQNAVVRRPIARIGDDVVRAKKKKKKLSPRVMKNRINDYFEWCEDNDEVPSIKGMMIHLKLYRNAFYEYMQDPLYTDLLEHARLIVSHWAEMDVYNTKGMAAGKLKYMENLHGWSSKVETKSEVKQISNPDDARKVIERLAPQLLEVLKNQHTVNQIAGPVEDAEIVEE